MDDLDAYFGDEAVDAFVSQINMEGFDGNEKHEFAAKLLENDDLLLGSLGGKEEEKKAGKVLMKRTAAPAQFSKMAIKDITNVIFVSELAGVMYPKDQMFINNFILDNRKKDTYDKQDLLDLTRMLIKTSI
jgi:hypothetical protein